MDTSPLESKSPASASASLGPAPTLANAVLPQPAAPAAAVTRRLLETTIHALATLAPGADLALKLHDLLDRVSVGVVFLLHRLFARGCVLLQPVPCRVQGARWVVCRGYRGGQSFELLVLREALARLDRLEAEYRAAEQQRAAVLAAAAAQADKHAADVTAAIAGGLPAPAAPAPIAVPPQQPELTVVEIVPAMQLLEPYFFRYVQDSNARLLPLEIAALKVAARALVLPPEFRWIHCALARLRCWVQAAKNLIPKKQQPSKPKQKK